MVEKKIRKLMSIYERNITSVLVQFPSHHIASVIDGHAVTLKTSAEREQFFATTRVVVQLVQCYRNGVRGRMKEIVNELLLRFYDVESNFQQGHYDKCVTMLREKHKDDMLSVVNTIFSHGQLTKKSLLIVSLIDHMKNEEPGLTEELAVTLNKLTSLSGIDHFTVALHARQVLITAHQPAYELRHNQMESILLSAVDVYGHDFHPENLQRLILSETSIVDILHEFFFHSNKFVCNAALEVYIRRSYISYDLTFVEHIDETVSGIQAPLVHFEFLLPPAHPNRLSSLITAANGSLFVRTGWMLAFNAIGDFKAALNGIFELLAEFSEPMDINDKILDELDATESTRDGKRHSTSINVAVAEPDKGDKTKGKILVRF